MAKKEITTHTIIISTPGRVWEILKDFAMYPKWNPFITEVSGKLEPGETLDVSISGMRFKPTVLVAEQDRELRWKGSVGFKGIFDGEHIMQIEDLGEGKVKFIHREKFSGLLVGVFSQKLEETKRGFQAMNQALKERAEKQLIF